MKGDELRRFDRATGSSSFPVVESASGNLQEKASSKQARVARSTRFTSTNVNELLWQSGYILLSVDPFSSSAPTQRFPVN